ncbi:gp15 [Listeria grandensis FSL F6-0971]|uniref:Gp15 n=1 Tax=Listeria grandensis FSL F6-0971 TaxID=1265819 RepID=W7BCC6_9LIST|nr:hypothetical protein [Listeria grandensis]EUJ24764.1 gp15 [Listeria grandensis FSL F6-0971]
MPEGMETYDAAKVSIIVDGLNYFGFSDGDMVNCSKDSNNAEFKSDAQGNASAAVNNDSLGTIKIDLAQTSPCYKHIVGLANSKKTFPIRIVDGNHVIGGLRAIVEKLPDAGYGKGVGTRSATIKVMDYSDKFN